RAAWRSCVVSADDVMTTRTAPFRGPGGVTKDWPRRAGCQPLERAGDPFRGRIPIVESGARRMVRRPPQEGEGVAMRAWMGLVLSALLWPASPAQAQDLTGRYVFQSPAGPVVLVLEQVANRVTGRMEGADGNVFGLQGQIDEAGRAIGTISVNGGTGWFAAGLVNGQLLMAVAEFDENGQPDMENGWSLTFERAGGAGGQGGAAPAMPGAAPAMPGAAPGGQGGMPGARQDSPLLREWRAHLSGKRVTYTDSYNSGGYGGYSMRWDAYI